MRRKHIAINILIITIRHSYGYSYYSNRRGIICKSYFPISLFRFSFEILIWKKIPFSLFSTEKKSEQVRYDDVPHRNGAWITRWWIWWRLWQGRWRRRRWSISYKIKDRIRLSRDRNSEGYKRVTGLKWKLLSGKSNMCQFNRFIIIYQLIYIIFCFSVFPFYSKKNRKKTHFVHT